MKISDFIFEGGGYIPQTEEEAHDPRYEMAITCDIKPGEDVRQAAKFKFKLDKGGIPPMMRSDGKLTESVEVNSLISFTKDIRRILGTNKFKFPYIHFVESPYWLGWCAISKNFGYHSTEIQLSNKLENENDIKRVLAHELCHDAEYLLYWLPLIEKRRSEGNPIDSKKFFSEILEDHGPQWQKGANQINTVYGQNYVTKTSDQSFVIGSPIHTQQSKETALATIPRYFNPGKRKVAESITPPNKNLQFLATQPKIGWDFYGTLVMGSASEKIVEFIKTHQNIKHYIITTTPDVGNLTKQLNPILSKVGLSSANFTKIIGFDVARGKRDRNYDRFEKSIVCQELGISVLVDDDIYRKDECRLFGIKYINPDDCISPEEFKSFGNRFNRK